jgi:hypothetical protein
MTKPLAWHLILRLVDDRVLATSTAARRGLARIVIRIAGPHGLLAFGAADTHLHVVVLARRDDAGEVARRLELALGNSLHPGVGFERARLRPIRDQRHLQSAFLYVLRQEEQHGIGADPFHEASALPELLALRVGGEALRRRVIEHLPRVRRGALLDALGRPALDQEPVQLDGDLREAGAAAFGLASLDVPGRAAVAARRGVVHAVGGGLSAATLAGRLGVGLRTVERMRSSKPDSFAVAAVRGQLRLRAARHAAPADSTGPLRTGTLPPQSPGDEPSPLQSGGPRSPRWSSPPRPPRTRPPSPKLRRLEPPLSPEPLRPRRKDRSCPGGTRSPRPRRVRPPWLDPG